MPPPHHVPPHHTWQFYDETISNAQVAESVVGPLLDRALSGSPSTLITFGQVIRPATTRNDGRWVGSTPGTGRIRLVAPLPPTPPAPHPRPRLAAIGPVSASLHTHTPPSRPTLTPWPDGYGQDVHSAGGSRVCQPNVRGARCRKRRGGDRGVLRDPWKEMVGEDGEGGGGGGCGEGRG